MKKTFKIAMLPTEIASDLWLSRHRRLYYQQANFDDEQTNQHLYIISDDEIKEGDWFLNELNQVWQHNGKIQPSIKSKKVIATTDKSLPMKEDMVGGFMTKLAFPQLPESFITKYIQMYNEGKIITEVDLECYFTHETEGDKFLNIKTREDNTVIVHPSKMYSRDEVENYIEKINEDFINKYSMRGLPSTFIKEWISENLK